MENRDDPLTEWNRLNVENAENAAVSVIFENIIESTRYFDNYSSWLTAGTAATTAFILTNVSTVLPFLTAMGFKLSGTLFVLSILLGVLSKFFAIQCQVADAQQESKTHKIENALRFFFDDQKKINEMAKAQGRSINTDLDMSRVITKSFAPFPKWVQWLAIPLMKKASTNPHVGYLIPLRFFRYQCATLALQVLALIAAAIIAFVFARNL